MGSSSHGARRFLATGRLKVEGDSEPKSRRLIHIDVYFAVGNRRFEVIKKLERREFMKVGVGTAVAALGVGMTATAEAAPGGQGKWPIEVAVYAEHSDTTKKMQPGFNIRVFNRREVQQAASISCDTATGIVTLQPGLYHITATSTVTYSDLDGKSGRVLIDPHPFGAYCRLRYAKDTNCKNEQAIVVGTVSNADMIPSTLETYLMVEKPVQIVLEHQAGGETEGIYLQENSNKSPWHVFARIAIRKQ